MVLFFWNIPFFCKTKILLKTTTMLILHESFHLISKIPKRDIKFFEKDISTYTKILPTPFIPNSFILWKKKTNPKLLCFVDSLSNILSLKEKDFKLKNPSSGYSSRHLNLFDYTITFLPQWFYSLVCRNKLIVDDV